MTLTLSLNLSIHYLNVSVIAKFHEMSITNISGTDDPHPQSQSLHPLPCAISVLMISCTFHHPVSAYRTMLVWPVTYLTLVRADLQPFLCRNAERGCGRDQMNYFWNSLGWCRAETWCGKRKEMQSSFAWHLQVWQIGFVEKKKAMKIAMACITFIHWKYTVSRCWEKFSLIHNSFWTWCLAFGHAYPLPCLWNHCAQLLMILACIYNLSALHSSLAPGLNMSWSWTPPLPCSLLVNF